MNKVGSFKIQCFAENAYVIGMWQHGFGEKKTSKITKKNFESISDRKIFVIFSKISGLKNMRLDLDYISGLIFCIIEFSFVNFEGPTSEPLLPPSLCKKVHLWISMLKKRERKVFIKMRNLVAIVVVVVIMAAGKGPFKYYIPVFLKCDFKH